MGIYIRTVLAIFILVLLSGLGARDSRFIAWLYYDVKVFVSYGEAESFTRWVSWGSILLFVASCIFFK
jgi:hypothetical protein